MAEQHSDASVDLDEDSASDDVDTTGNRLVFDSSVHVSCFGSFCFVPFAHVVVL